MIRFRLKRVGQAAATLLCWSFAPWVFITDSFVPAIILLALLVIYQIETWFRSGAK